MVSGSPQDERPVLVDEAEPTRRLMTVSRPPADGRPAQTPASTWWRWASATTSTRLEPGSAVSLRDLVGQADQLQRRPNGQVFASACEVRDLAGPNVRHERRRKGREAAFGTSARWRG